MVSVIVPTTRNHPALLRCLDALTANTEGQWEAIVVDQSEPRGYVSACRQGLGAASGDVLILLNDDCVVQAGWLPPLLNAIAAGAWLVGPRWKHARLAGHCLVMSRHCYSATHGLNGAFRHWCADHDLELRVADMGGQIRQVAASLVKHDAESEHRIYYRASAKVGDWERLPNLGQWYLEDMDVYRSIWGERKIHQEPDYEETIYKGPIHADE